MALTPQELARLAYDAGFRGDAIRWAVAIALAESGGNPGAYNPELAAGTQPGGGSRGLWQIYGTAHPKYNSSIAFDPVTNARAAYEVYAEQGGKFTPWSTFNNGMAASFYNQLDGLRVGGKTRQSKIETRKTTASTNVPIGTSPNLGGKPITSALGGGLGENVTQAQALQSIASGDWATNAVSKIVGLIDIKNSAFTFAGLILILIGLFVLLRQPAAQAAEGAFNLYAASQGVPVKIGK